MTSLEQRIEQYLMEAPGDGWVKSDLLCARFDINERQLRKVGNDPGLCTGFAISISAKGYKHVQRATPSEYRQFKHGMRRHAINELRRVATLDKRRHQVTVATKRPEFIRERDTNQGLLFSIPQPRPW